MAYNKPLPVMQGWTKEFYEFCRKRELRLQRCKHCRTWRHIARPMCSVCQSWDWEWAKASGRGTLFTWCTVYEPPTPLFEDEAPYAGIVVELEEGPRMVSWIGGIDPAKLRAGMPLEVWFDDVTPEITLPKFKPAS
ncbi:MAG: Zn-ribbon domain-containing OB-fold protein [Candidatus Binatia bacterium]